MVSGTFAIQASDGRYVTHVTSDLVSHLDTTKKKVNVYVIADLLDSWIGLLADSPLNSVRTRSEKPKVTFENFRKDFLRGPLVEFIMRYASLADEIVQSCRLYGQGSLTGSFIQGMLHTPIVTEYISWRRTGDAATLQYILSFLYFAKKLRYEDESLDSTALRGWNSVEEKLSDLELDVEITSGLRKIVSGLLETFRPEPFWPRYGPGKVSERDVVGVIGKSNNLHYSHRLDRAFFSGTFASYGLSEELGLSPEKVLPDPTVWREAKKVVSEIARLKFVPKTVKTSRTICMEPNSFMFFQQGLARWIVNAMDRGPARRFVRLEDQSVNRRLAAYGSRTGRIDTIDLSSASDSVSVALVKAIFPRLPLFYLLSTRTSLVRMPGGEVRKVKKFAPMGSALCFPTQCIIFTSVVIYAAMSAAHGLGVGETVPLNSPYFANIQSTVDSLFSTFEGRGRDPGCVRFEPASVYGDDICCDEYLTAYVTHLLSRLGFEVNLKKSFRSGQCYRESCGGHYWCGEDVTPLYFRVQRSSRLIDANYFTTAIAACNHAGDRHYTNLRRCLVQRLLYTEIDRGDGKGRKRSLSINPVPFSNRVTDSGMIFSTRAKLNSHLMTRYNLDYQKDEYRCLASISGKRTKAREFEIPALDRYLYQRWMGSRYGVVNLGDNHFSMLRNDASGSRLAWRWIPRES